MSPPWYEFDAVFVGGDTAWKLGPEARRIVRICKEHDKHVHVGRVNTLRRLRYAQSIGVDSVDGTKWAEWRDTYRLSWVSFLTGSVSDQSRSLDRDSSNEYESPLITSLKKAEQDRQYHEPSAMWSANACLGVQGVCCSRGGNGCARVRARGSGRT